MRQKTPNIQDIKTKPKQQELHNSTTPSERKTKTTKEFHNMEQVLTLAHTHRHTTKQRIPSTQNKTEDIAQK